MQSEFQLHAFAHNAYAGRISLTCPKNGHITTSCEIFRDRQEQRF
jgi:hypothetical protein